MRFQHGASTGLARGSFWLIDYYQALIGKRSNSRILPPFGRVFQGVKQVLFSLEIALKLPRIWRVFRPRLPEIGTIG